MSKYRYEIWKNILTKLEVGKEYSVNNTREDYVEFVDALKTFAKHWWNFVVLDYGENVTFVMLDPVRCVQEMIDLYEEKGDPKPEEAKRDDFYTKAYNPENMEAQRKEWEARNAEAKARRALRGAQTNDLPKDDPNYTQSNPSPSSVLKSNENDRAIKKDHDKTEETEY